MTHDCAGMDGSTETPSSNPRMIGTPTEICKDCLELDSRVMLRATPLHEVLKHRGRILRNSVGSADTYNLSREVDQIDCFLSHNWSTPRYVKFLTLVLHFHSRQAWAAPLLFAITIIVLSSCNVLPLWDRHREVDLGNGVHGTFSGKMSIFCAFFATPVYMVSICYGHNVWAVLGFRGRTVFLDKVCIHQTDTELQRRGIQNLGAFINNSSCLLAVFADTYLAKLWTMYELATFLCSNAKNKKLILCPPFMSKFVMWTTFLYTVCWNLFYAVEMFGPHKTTDRAIARFIFFLGVTFILAFPLIFVLQKWEREVHRMQIDIANFQTASAKCFCEDDRPLVNGIIVAFMKKMGYCSDDASDEGALKEFDDIVHKVVPSVLQASLGRVGLRYSHILIITQFQFWVKCDTLCGMIHEGASLQQMLALILETTANHFLWQPIVFALLADLAKRHIGTHGWRRWVVNSCLALMVSALTALVAFLHVALALLGALKSVAWLGALVALAFCWLCLTYYIYYREGGEFEIINLKQKPSMRVQNGGVTGQLRQSAVPMDPWPEEQDSQVEASHCHFDTDPTDSIPQQRVDTSNGGIQNVHGFLTSPDGNLITL